MKAVDQVNTKKKYEPILPGPKEWPVVQLSKNRSAFIDEVVNETIVKLRENAGSLEDLIEDLELTLHKEKLRIKQSHWEVDPEDDDKFWGQVKSKLVNLRQNDNAEEEVHSLLHSIASRYVDEIAGNFKSSSYRVARRIITSGFNRLLNASQVKGFSSLWSTELSLQDKIQITGEAEHLRKLAKIGTVVVVPTHFSNLDSILIGWIIHVLGLPPFIYGAGLNLFNIDILAYFMNSLGAYKVDRRKKNNVYLESLKSYSSLALQKGCHSLFFPGGTRSRSGRIETRLKLGLLSTALEAQRINFENSDDESDKIFIVPMVINYHFVLEAPSLINEYLKAKGQERYYVENDEFSTSYKMLKFLFKFFTKGSEMSVSIGRGMDLFGNYVDDEGRSKDSHGRKINTRDYFMSDGKITKNIQREQEYTRRLSQVIVDEYHKVNRVFASQLVAFTAFEMIKKQYPKLDLYNLLRLSEEDIIISYQAFSDTFERLRNRVFELYDQDKLQVAPHMVGDLDEVINRGLANVGMYHSKHALLKGGQGNIITQDLNILYFYHNRLHGYGLEASV